MKKYLLVALLCVMAAFSTGCATTGDEGGGNAPASHSGGCH